MKLRVLTLVVTLFAGVTAQASTILFEGSISSGTASQTPAAIWTGLIGNVSGPDFSVFINTRGYYNVNGQWGANLKPGTNYIWVSGGTGGEQGIGGGSFDLNGTHYACVTSYPLYRSTCGSGFDMWFTLSDLPDFGYVRGFSIDFTTPFTAEVGFGCGSTSECGGDYRLVAFGSGIATVTLDYRPALSGDYYVFGSATYVFTPEPATMTLAGLGLLAVILLRRRAASACAHT